MHWLRHAFAVDPPGPAEPTDAERPVVDRVCAEISRRRMTTPALLLLESSRPLGFLASQAMHLFTPALSVLTDTGEYERFAAFLSRRGSIDWICENAGSDGGSRRPPRGAGGDWLARHDGARDRLTQNGPRSIRTRSG